MKKDNTVFKRYEIKFLVSKEQKNMLEDIFREKMVPDEYGKSSICNLYYDTPTYRLIRKSMEKPAYKEKMRLRSYGTVKEDGKVFLELKKKYKGVVYKRRIGLRYDEAMAYLSGESPLPKDSQIAREIDYFRSYYGDLSPKAFISYDRTAYFDKDDDSFRVTFDENIRYREKDMSLTIAPSGRNILDPGCALMEVKTAGAIPLWLVDILNREGIRQCSFSKYGRAYSDMLKSNPELIEQSAKMTYLEKIIRNNILPYQSRSEKRMSAM